MREQKDEEQALPRNSLSTDARERIKQALLAAKGSPIMRKNEVVVILWVAAR
jgi:hypothetical protein